MIFDELNFDYNLKYVVNQLKNSLRDASCIPVMPRIVEYSSIKDEIVSLDMVPIGMELSSNCALTYDFSRLINLIVYSNEKIAVSFTTALIHTIHDLANTKIIVLDSMGVTTKLEDVQVFTSNFKKIVEAIINNINEKKSLDVTAEKIVFIISGYQKINLHLKKMKEEDPSTLTIDDMIMAAVGSVNFKFIIINDKSLKSIDDRDWSDYLDYGYGIMLGMEKDDQSLIDCNDTYDEVLINKDTAIVVDDFKKKYAKFIRNRGE
jgi:hypothetical protein